MARTSFLMLAVTFSLFAPTIECRAQVGFGTRQGTLTTGGRVNVAPVVTNNGRYARMSMSVGVSELVDVYTFSPVRGFAGLMPVNPIGPIRPGYGRSVFNPGIQGFDRAQKENVKRIQRIPKPTASRFVDAAWKFDGDKDARLDRNELGKLALAAVTELKRTPAAYEKLKRGAQGNKRAGQPVTQKAVTEAFLKQCLTFDRDKDGRLNPSETDVMATALIRFLK